jgi:hypothetical protein
MEQEYFKPIKDYETYAISNYGNVKDLRTGKLLPMFPNELCGGYLQVNIRNPEKNYTQARVHRLVGLNLINNPNNLEEIDHIDRDVKNNNINNLRWVSRSDNQINKLYTPHSKNPYRNIYYDAPNSSKKSYSCWTIQIKNSKLSYKKRFRTDKYTLEYVKNIRDELFKNNNIPIND